MKKNYIYIIIGVVIAIAAFAGGMFYEGKTAASSAAGTGRANASSLMRRGFGGSGGNNGGFATGQILSKDSQSITLQLPNGNSQIVFYSSSTQVIRPVPGSVNDLVSGANVSVGGAQNADGSVTAQTIQVREGNGFVRG